MAFEEWLPKDEIQAPVSGRMGGGFGDDRGGGRKHLAGDVYNNEGTPVYAPANVRVLAPFEGGREGSHMSKGDYGVDLEDMDRPGRIYKNVHMANTLHLKQGQEFRRGEQIGVIGGAVKNPHLHFAIIDNDQHVDWPSLYGFKRGVGMVAGQAWNALSPSQAVADEPSPFDQFLPKAAPPKQEQPSPFDQFLQPQEPEKKAPPEQAPAPGIKPPPPTTLASQEGIITDDQSGYLVSHAPEPMPAPKIEPKPEPTYEGPVTFTYGGQPGSTAPATAKEKEFEGRVDLRYDPNVGMKNLPKPPPPADNVEYRYDRANDSWIPSGEMGVQPVEFGEPSNVVGMAGGAVIHEPARAMAGAFVRSLPGIVGFEAGSAVANELMGEDKGRLEGFLGEFAMGIAAGHATDKMLGHARTFVSKLLPKSSSEQVDKMANYLVELAQEQAEKTTSQYPSQRAIFDIGANNPEMGGGYSRQVVSPDGTLKKVVEQEDPVRKLAETVEGNNDTNEKLIRAGMEYGSGRSVVPPDEAIAKILMNEAAAEAAERATGKATGPMTPTERLARQTEEKIADRQAKKMSAEGTVAVKATEENWNLDKQEVAPDAEFQQSLLDKLGEGNTQKAARALAKEMDPENGERNFRRFMSQLQKQGATAEESYPMALQGVRDAKAGTIEAVPKPEGKPGTKVKAEVPEDVSYTEDYLAKQEQNLEAMKKGVAYNEGKDATLTAFYRGEVKKAEAHIKDVKKRLAKMQKEAQVDVVPASEEHANMIEEARTLAKDNPQARGAEAKAKSLDQEIARVTEEIEKLGTPTYHEDIMKLQRLTDRLLTLHQKRDVAEKAGLELRNCGFDLIQSIKDLTGKIEESAVYKRLQRAFAPHTMGPQAKQASVTMQGYFGKMALDQLRAEQAVAPYRKFFDNMSRDQIWGDFGFIYKMERGQDVGPELRPLVTFYQRFNEDFWRRAQAAGLDLKYVDNYMRHMWKDPRAASSFSDNYTRSLRGTTKFERIRKNNYYSDGFAEGLQPKYEHPIDLIMADMAEKYRWMAGQDLFNDMVKKGLAVRYTYKAGERGAVPQGLYPISDLLFTDRSGRWYAPEGVVDIINNLVNPGLKGVTGFDAYRNITQKVNTYRVSLSAFHWLFETLSVPFQEGGMHLYDAFGKLFSGNVQEAAKSAYKAGKTYVMPWKPVVEYYRLGRDLENAAKNIAGEAALEPTVQEMAGAGVRFQHRFYTGGASPLSEAEAQAAAIKGKDLDVYRHKFYVMEDAYSKSLREFAGDVLGLKWGKALEGITRAISRPLMEVYVPRLKLGATYKLMERELALVDQSWGQVGRTPRMLTAEENARYVMDRQEAVNDSWSHVENVFGQLTYDNLHMRRVFRDMMHAWVAYPGWSVGNLRTLSGIVRGSYQGLSGGTIDRRARNSMEYGLGLLAAGLPFYNTILQLAMGQGPPKDWRDVFLGPRTGATLPNGAPERWRLPTYGKDYIPLFKNLMEGKPLHTIYQWESKINWVPTLLGELNRNTDFYGVEIMPEYGDPDTLPMRKVMGLAGHLAQTVEPFSFNQFMRGRGVAGKIGGFGGFTPPPRELVNTDLQNYMDYYAKTSAPAVRSQDAFEFSRSKAEIMDDMRSGRVKEGWDKIDKLQRKDLISPQNLEKMFQSLALPPLVDRFRNMPLEASIQAMKLANPEELEMLKPHFYDKLDNAEDFTVKRNMEGIEKVLKMLGNKTKDRRPEWKRSLGVPTYEQLKEEAGR